MEENKKEGKQVYEIGYLLVSSLPEEKVDSEISGLRDMLSKKGADFIAEEAPELRSLAYTMTKKIGQMNQRFDKGYFGWFKFEVSISDIDNIKKAFEENPHILRILLVTTIRENTYLGKKSPLPMPVSADIAVEAITESATEISPITASAEEIDKSIDAMVKEA